MKVLIYGRQNCTYCKQAVQLCEMRGLEYVYKDISDPLDGEQTLTELTESMGSTPRTVPQIFVDGQHVGGFTQFLTVVDATRSI